MDNAEIIKVIKSSFCNLTDAKIRKNFIEIITGYSTINFKFISVFVYKNQNGKYVVSDYGWLDQNYYDMPSYENQEDISERIKNTFMNVYDIKQIEDNNKNIFYYKSTDNVNSIPSLIFDLANFMVGTVNAFCLKYRDERDDKEKESFRLDANAFLRQNYNDNVRWEKNLIDFKHIKFNAVIYKGTKLNLLTYITGSTPQYFENGLRKSIVNFEISERSKDNRDIIEKISIINDYSEGFQKLRSESLIDFLSEKTTRKPILWSEKEKILQII